jgi:hypothetical protein
LPIIRSRSAAQHDDIIAVTEEPFIDLHVREVFARLDGFADNPGKELPPFRIYY